MANPDPPPAPPWVKAFGVLGLALFVVFIVLHVTGRSPHGHSGHPGSVAPTKSSSP